MLEGEPTLYSMLQSFNGAEGYDLHTRLECLTAKFHDLARQILWRIHTGQPSKDIHKKYRASVLLRSYYIVEDGKSPYLDATKKPDTRYSYLYSALLADMNIFSGINIR